MFIDNISLGLKAELWYNSRLLFVDIYPYFLSHIHDATSQFRHKVDDGTSITEDR